MNQSFYIILKQDITVEDGRQRKNDCKQQSKIFCDQFVLFYQIFTKDHLNCISKKAVEIYPLLMGSLG